VSKENEKEKYRWRRKRRGSSLLLETEELLFVIDILKAGGESDSLTLLVIFDFHK